jgi:hypothetical protein
MNYRDLQNISNLSQQILVEGANEEHNVLNRWPYTSPYLQDDIVEKEDSEYEKTRLMQSEGSFNNLIDTGANMIKEPIQNYANKKVGGIAGSLGIPGAVAGQKVDQTASDLKKGNYGKALNTVVGGVRNLTQSVDLYDIILSHLLDEGYADTVENAESIMVNMSEDWRESICEANRGDEYATRGMSPDDALKYKQERRNNEFVSNKPKPMRNYYGGHSSSELNSMRQENKPKKKSLPTSAGYDPKTGKRDINKIPMGKYENMLDKKRNPERHKGYYG